MKRPLLLIALLTSLDACATYDDTVHENVVPKDYKSTIIDQLRTKLDDPTNIRDAFIAEPALKPVDGTTRYIVCVRFNAKNDSGQYAGSKDMAAYYFDGQLTQMLDANRETCGNAAYKPFPELQKVCRTIDCK